MMTIIYDNKTSKNVSFYVILCANSQKIVSLIIWTHDRPSKRFFCFRPLSFLFVLLTYDRYAFVSILFLTQVQSKLIVFTIIYNMK